MMRSSGIIYIFVVSQMFLTMSFITKDVNTNLQLDSLPKRTGNHIEPSPHLSLNKIVVRATRDYVINSFMTEFGRRIDANILNWTGDIASCDVGTISTEYKLSIVQRINWYRDMQGLPPLRHDNGSDFTSQAGAMVLSCNQIVTQYISPTFTCYSTQASYGTSSSLLAAGSNSGIEMVNELIEDNDIDNFEVLHRSYLMTPDLSAVGVGQILSTTPNANKGVLVINIADNLFTEPPKTYRENFIAWPTPGYFPYLALPKNSRRWSYYPFGSQDIIDFSLANVSVIGPNGPLITNIICRSSNQFGSILVWENTIPPPTNSIDREYIVTIDNIIGPPGIAAKVIYNVIIMNIMAPIVPSSTPSMLPTGPSFTPTYRPTRIPTAIPSILPTQSTNMPSINPSSSPSFIPTSTPQTSSPSYIPTLIPTYTPSNYPFSPGEPTRPPIAFPTITPSNYPSKSPTISPSIRPTITPTLLPSLAFGTTYNPTVEKTIVIVTFSQVLIVERYSLL